MNKNRTDSLLLFCNFIIAIAMATFAYETYNNSNIVLSVIFAAVSVIIFAFVIFSFVFKCKFKGREN
ncbi:hypothetical protein OKW24_005279 [Peribacillus simplex]|nr:hypothetical protein [Peribacillus simplex]